MSEVFQTLVVEPEGMRKLGKDFEIAWTLIQDYLDPTAENEQEERFRLARIMMNLMAEEIGQEDLVAKAAAEWINSRP